jgi:hypothetical protein
MQLREVKTPFKLEMLNFEVLAKRDGRLSKNSCDE